MDYNQLKTIGFGRSTSNEMDPSFDKWYFLYGYSKYMGMNIMLNCKLYRVKDNEFKIFTDKHNGKGLTIDIHTTYNNIEELKKDLVKVFEFSNIHNDSRLITINKVND